MKILICSAGYNSLEKNTVGIFQLDQAKALANLGHEVRIASIDIRSARHHRKLGTYSYFIGGLRVSTSNYMLGRFPVRKVFDGIAKRCAYSSFKEATKDGWKPEILHAHFVGVAAAYAEIATKYKYPYIVTEHYSKLHTDDVDRKLLKNALYAYSKADKVIAVSNSLSESIKKNTGFDAIIVPNIVDVNLFFRNPCVQKNEKFTFVAAGRIVREKGMDVLIRAFAEMKSDEVQLLVMGDGPEKQALIKLADELNISEHVVFLGIYTREQFNAVLNKSDCFVLTSRGETFGVVYIEAMLTGKPVIATACGGPEDFINDKVGVLVPIDNVDTLVSAMKIMVKEHKKYDPVYIENYARNAFGPDTVAKKLTEIYQGVMK